MKRLLPLGFLLLGFAVNSQTVIDWNDLGHGVSFDATADGFIDIDGAIFSSEIKELDGKMITLTGYLLVLGGDQSTYLLSKNPMASCFFCGNGGPESIAEIKFTNKQDFKMDDLILVEGTLRLNKGDFDSCYYRIENASGFGL